MPVISNRPRASRSSHFEITCVITPWIVLHSGQLQLLSSPLWRTDIQTILLSSTLLTNPGLHWTFLEVARRNFSNFLGFIILQVMVCSKEQSSLIPQYKRHRHRSQLSHQSPDLRLRRAARVSKQETRLSWSSYGPMISTAWKARTVGKLGMKLLELWTINKASQKQ